MSDAMMPWVWLAAGLVLVAAETMAPGVFLLWIGLAAVVTGLSLFLLPLGTAMALILFAVLCVVLMLVGRRFYGTEDTPADAPFLNRRADALIGREFILDHPIVQGEGRVRVHDSVWRVQGPDAEIGVKVRVTGVIDGVMLAVAPVVEAG